jgi:hypothetical protein
MMKSSLRALVVAGVFLASMLLAAFPAASAEYASIAHSADGKQWGWARKQTQKLADRAALDGCNQGAPKKDCRIIATKALVLVQGAKRFGYAASDVSLQEARQSALRYCGDSDCKVTNDFTTPGFLAVARTKSEQSEPYFFVAYAYANSDAADQAAISGCAQKAKEDCRVVWSGAIPGDMGTKGPTPVQAPAAGRDAPSCRPTTQNIRCSSQCTNGSCIVSYENGCRIRVQVSPRFDPFKNQWIYPAPSC